MFIPTMITFSFAFVFYIGAIILHLLVIQKKIPFKLVNGGRSTTFEEQAKQSQSSIVILGIGLFYVLSGLLFPTLRKTMIYMILSFLLALLWLFGTVMQILGTKFERYYISWLNLIGTIAHIELALQYFVEGDQ